MGDKDQDCGFPLGTHYTGFQNQKNPRKIPSAFGGHESPLEEGF